MSTNISEHFNKFFRVMYADDDNLIQAAQALRYKVYCEETRFEDPGQHQDHRERDAYDDRSIHSIITYQPQTDAEEQNIPPPPSANDGPQASSATFQAPADKINAEEKGEPPRKTNEVIATVRLILPDGHDMEGDFPTERYGGIDPKIRADIDKRYARSAIAEPSRFCVSRTFRKRFREAETIHGIVDTGSTDSVAADRRVTPHISLGLIQAALDMSRRQSIKLWYAIMEPQLVRLLKRFGVHFTQIGEPVNYHGIRVPCMVPIDETFARMKAECPEVWDFITREGRLWPY